MLHDVSTRWNSTYDMLCFVVEYRKAIEVLTLEQKNNLHQFKLDEEEWGVAAELMNMLEVCDASVT